MSNNPYGAFLSLCYLYHKEYLTKGGQSEFVLLSSRINKGLLNYWFCYDSEGAPLYHPDSTGNSVGLRFKCNIPYSEETRASTVALKFSDNLDGYSWPASEV